MRRFLAYLLLFAVALATLASAADVPRRLESANGPISQLESAAHVPRQLLSEPNANDLAQKIWITNCWMPAAMQAVATKDAATLSAMITRPKSTSHIFKVTFPPSFRSARTTTIPVDTRKMDSPLVLTNWGRSLWAQVFAEAMTKLIGDRDSRRGQTTGYGLDVIYGETNVDSVTIKLGQPGTREVILEALRRAESVPTVVAFKRTTPKVFNRHVYSIVKTKTVKGESFVYVRNPWPLLKASKVPLEDFIKNLDDIAQKRPEGKTPLIFIPQDLKAASKSTALSPSTANTPPSPPDTIVDSPTPPEPDTESSTESDNADASNADEVQTPKRRKLLPRAGRRSRPHRLPAGHD